MNLNPENDLITYFLLGPRMCMSFFFSVFYYVMVQNNMKLLYGFVELQVH